MSLNNEPDHTYIDISVINNDSTGLLERQKLAFTETRTIPYVYNPSDYYMSIIRFALQSSSLPVFIPQIMIGQPDINKTTYSLTLTYKNFVYQQFIIYEPQDLSTNLPNPPLITQDMSNKYYYVYSYQHFIKIINKAFDLAMIGLNALVVAGGDILPSNNVPYIDYDPNGKLANLICDKAGFDEALANPIKIWFNSPLYHLFATLHAEYYGVNVTNGRNYQISIYNTKSNELLLTGYTALIMYQEITTVALWCPIQSIVFQCATLPVAQTLTSPPRVFGSNTTVSQIFNSNSSAPIMTDLEIGIDALNQYIPNILYVPQSEYRLIDLVGNTPLYSIDINVYWKDRFGILREFELNSGCSSDIKIMLRNKTFNKTVK
jgi:hypothetical protein